MGHSPSTSSICHLTWSSTACGSLAFHIEPSRLTSCNLSRTRACNTRWSFFRRTTSRTHSVSGFKDFLFGYHILQPAKAVPSPVSIATSIGYTGGCNESYNKELYSVLGTDPHNQLFLNAWSPAGIQLDTHFILMFESPRTCTSSSTTRWCSQVDHESPHTESPESITQTSQSSQSSPLPDNVDSYTPGKDNHN